MRRRSLLQAAGAVLGAPLLAHAQSYPARPIRYIVPVASVARQLYPGTRYSFSGKFQA